MHHHLTSALSSCHFAYSISYRPHGAKSACATYKLHVQIEASMTQQAGKVQFSISELAA